MTPAAAALVSSLEARERAGADRDDEGLVLDGINAAVAGQEDEKDEAVLGWLERGPSPLRLDLVAMLFHGMWRRRNRERPVPEDRVRRLVAARRGLALSPGAVWSYVLALCEALAPDATSEARSVAAAALLEAQAGAPASYDARIRRAVAQALSAGGAQP